MNREDIIRMAREAGFEDFDRWCQHYPQETKRWCERMERFAALVAAAEREACAKRLEAVGCDHCAANIRARSATK